MHITEIEILNIELNNVCNLSCPLCQRQSGEIQSFLKKKNHLDFDILLRAIDKMVNLKTVMLFGNLSEPVLYYRFLELIKNLKERDLKIDISTNGNPHNKEFWTELGKTLDYRDSVIFSIDGSTQEKYSKYRVNGKLKSVIRNYKYFAENTSAKKIIQIIKFPWLDEINSEFEELRKIINPDNKMVYNFYRKIRNNHTIDEIQTKEDSVLNRFYEKIISKNSKLDKPKIECFSSKDKNLYLNYLGDIIPCCFTHEDFMLERNNPNQNIPNIYSDDFQETFKTFFVDWYSNKIYQTQSCLETCSRKLNLLRR